MKTLIAALAVGTLLGASAAEAGVIHGRQLRQDRRIDRGVCSGSLTRAETRILRAEQRRIARARSRAWSDGVMSRHEAKQLARVQNRADDHIYKLLYNRRTR